MLGTPVDLHGFADVPVTYVRLLLDQTLPLEQQDRAIAAVGAVRPPDVVELEAGHMAMVSRPEELAAIINAHRG